MPVACILGAPDRPVIGCVLQGPRKQWFDRNNPRLVGLALGTDIAVSTDECDDLNHSAVPADSNSGVPVVILVMAVLIITSMVPLIQRTMISILSIYDDCV